MTAAAGLLWVVAMIKLFSVLLVGTLLAGCERPASLTQADREAVLQIDDLVLWIEDFSPDASKESLKKTKDFDNSYYVEYEYDDSLNEEALYLSYDVSLQPTKWDASLIYQSQKFGANLGLFGEDSKQVPRNDLFRWGDESNFSLLQFEDGISFGNLFVARKGKRVVMLVLSGVYFDRAEDVHNLLDEKLEALERLPAP